MTDELSPSNRFNYAVNIVLQHEGGYTNDLADPGGATNFGITQKELSLCYERLNIPESVKKLTNNDAKIYYKSEWWDKYHYDGINSLYIATKILDIAVNIGPYPAHTLIQKTVNEYLKTTNIQWPDWIRKIYFLDKFIPGDKSIPVDGLFGGITIGAINSICENYREIDLASLMQHEQKMFYINLVKEKPQLKTFLQGWLKRAEY